MPVNTTVGTAARFGLTVAGGYFFGPAGAAAGALVGSFLFGGGGPDIEGPRLGDLSVSGATYGGVRPVGYGVHKVAGTMIWARDIIEVKSTRKEGGSLFGGGQKITEYRYYGSFAVALAEGPASGVIRIRANDKLIANYEAPDFTADPLSAEEVMKYYGANSRFNIRVYLGGDDQEPDRIIREHVEEVTGEANITPAFRGTVYLVFDRIPLDEFNNQIPAITAEVAWAGQDEIQDRAITFGGGPVTGGVDTSHYAVDWQRGYAFFNSSTGLRRVRLLDGVEDLSVLWSVGNVGHVIDPTDDGKQLLAVLTDPEGNVYAIDNDANYGAVAKIDPDTLHVMARAEDGLAFMTTAALVNVYNLAARDGFLWAGNAQDQYRIWRTSTMTHVFTDTSAPGTLHSAIAGREDQDISELYVASNAGGAINIRRLEIAFTAGRINGNPTGIELVDYTIPAGDLGGSSSLSVSGPIAYEATLDAIVVRALLDGADTLIFAWRVADGVLWQIGGLPTGIVVPKNLRITRGRFATQVTTTSANLYVFDTTLGTQVALETGYNDGAGQAPQYDPLTHQVIRGQQGDLFQAWRQRVSRLTVGLGAVVTSLCARVGIPSADLDVAELTDQVKGMALGRQMPVRGALELLAVTYNFDCAESDYQLVFKKRGRDPVRALAEDDLVAERQELIVEERAQDVDLPLRVTLTYQDHDRDAEPAAQTAQRIKNPNPTMYSDNAQSIELPITLTAQEAREIVVRQCFAPWAERTKLAFALSQEHLDLDPGDVVTLLLDSGRQLDLRAVVMGIGRDLSIRLEAVTESSSSYDVSSVQASGGLSYAA